MSYDFLELQSPDFEHNYKGENKEKTYLSEVDDYIDFLFPNLLPNESIALFLKRSKPKTEFFASKDLLKTVIRNGLKDCDMYISLSTCVAVKGEPVARKSENMHRRFCIGFDFDKKDFIRKFDSIYDFARHFKATTGLFIHFGVDSGHGYHFYVGIEETKDIARVANITRRYAILADADCANVSLSQTLRMPGTLNHKDSLNPLSVNIVFGYTKDKYFRRYTLGYLESRLKPLEKERGIGRANNRKKSINTRKFKNINAFPCVAVMLRDGVLKGERNKCLGRIVSYFRDVAGLSQDSALETILSWNERCNALCADNEQKSVNEITADFYRYWKNNNYNLLGCISESNSISDILAKYCDETICPKNRKGPQKEDGTQFLVLDKRYATDKCLRTLNGYAYLILKVLIQSKTAVKVSELVGVTGFSKQTVIRSLNALLDLDLIHKSTQGVDTYKAKNYALPKQYITLPVKLFDMLVDKVISEQELLLYIAIRRNAYASKKCTYEELGKLLGINKISVYRTVKLRMEVHGLLEIEHKPTGNFFSNERKNGEKYFNYYRFPLEVAEKIDDEEPP